MTRPLLPLVALAFAACGAFDAFGPGGIAREPVEEDPVDAGGDAGNPSDSGRIDAGSTDAGPTDAGGEDIDAGPVDAGEEQVDAGPIDAGPIDAGPIDAGPIDAGPIDAGPESCPTGMVELPRGTFTMGRADGGEDEREPHRVTISRFCLDRTEVTVAAYSTWETPAATAGEAVYSPYCNGTKADRQDHPVNCVTQTKADFYCRSRSARLPTEAEWEYAARGAAGSIYPWGDDPPGPTTANLCGTECKSEMELIDRQFSPIYPSSDGFAATAPVGSFAADTSWAGVQDLGGNVKEWVADLYTLRYASADVTDPLQTVGIGAGWVMRGGTWGSERLDQVAATYRLSAAASTAWPWLGFRCAKTLR